MFVIPVNSSILYVEPVYLEATNSSIPEVKRIIVAYGDRIAYEETLEECLVSLFGEEAADSIDASDESVTQEPSGDGGQTETGQPSEELSQTELIQNAVTAYDNAQAAVQNGDWAGYGRYMEELEQILNELAS